MTNYTAIANQYADEVLSGKVMACEFVHQACYRYLDDKENQRTDDFPYYYDEVTAQRACKFIGLLPHIKGKWAGSNLELSPWQVFITCQVFGWRHADTGNRRFKQVYVEVPRKNGKSTWSSAIMLYCLCADNEAGAEVYSAATSRDQARIVFDDAKAMVERCEGLRNRFGVESSAHSVYVQSTSSKCKPLSRDHGGNLDGLNVHFACIDELHAHKDSRVLDVIDTATGAREQPLIWMITTAGSNRSGVCFQQREYTRRLLAGSATDPEFFGIIYTIDDDDDWTNPAIWAKANPNYGAAVSEADMHRQGRKAMEMSSEQNNFLTKRLNVWVNADVAWMNMQKWEAAGDSDYHIDDWEGRPCWIGMDLASKVDIAALCILFEDEGLFYPFFRFYLPEETASLPHNKHYAAYALDGNLILTPGSTIDYEFIEEEIGTLASRFDINEILYDPWQAHYLVTRLQKKSVELAEFSNTVANFSEPMKELEALTVSNRIRHNANPVMSWMMSNVVAHTDAKSNIYPRKTQDSNKIDGVVALIMCIARAYCAEQQGPLTANEVIGSI